MAPPRGGGAGLRLHFTIESLARRCRLHALDRMPELPDVEVFRAHVAKTALHQRILDVEVRRPRVLGNTSAPRLNSALAGHAFTHTHRHGKHLFIRVDSAGWLAMHFGMTGSLQYVPAAASPGPDVRVLFDFVHGNRLAYYDPRLLGRMNLVDDPASYVAQRGLGPDALDLELKRADFEAALRGAKGIIKSALMDQARIAGIGNLYSDEILYHAHVHPKTAVASLDDAAWRRLYEATRTVLKEAIARGAEPERLPGDYLLRHRRSGDDCPCGGQVEKAVIAGRSAYFCPRCQPAP